MKIINKNFSIGMNKGFTLIEIIVVIAVIGIIISFGTIMDLSVLERDTFSTERSTIVSVLEKARSRAMANMFESPHGVCYVAPNYVIFQGSTCTASGSELIPANQNIAVLSDFTNPAKFPTIVFTQLSGNTTGSTIVLTDGVKSSNIEINNEGTINW